MTYAPHTGDDVEAMLDVVRAFRSTPVGTDLDSLFAHIPGDLLAGDGLDLPFGVSEDEVAGTVGALAARNRTDLVCFAGGGAYDHMVPAVVPALVSRGELLTSYTPYQPEVSQGVLQALFEYQTVISELTGLPVANASLYDGGSAVAEAVSMAAAGTRRSGVVLSGGLDAPSREIVTTYAHPVGRAVQTVALDPVSGRTPVPSLSAEGGSSGIDASVGCVVIAQPNALGVVEDVRAHAEAARAAGATLIVKFEPTAAGLLATPGSQGAGIVVGEGQPLGQGLSYGGPTFGFLACTADQVRKIPGRVVGSTVDVDGRLGYVMTLRAREQDIRRERATSNICTNQTLCAIAGLIHVAWLGPAGLRELAEQCLARTRYAAERLTALDGVELAVDGPFIKEFAVQVADCDADRVIDELVAGGYLVGPVVPDGPAAGAIMVAVTERRSRSQIDGLVDAFARAVKEVR